MSIPTHSAKTPGVPVFLVAAPLDVEVPDDDSPVRGLKELLVGLILPEADALIRPVMSSEQLFEDHCDRY